MTPDIIITIPQANSTTIYLDDDGKPKRTGTVWTASAHIVTAVIGSGVLSLAWAVAQLGWIFGPLVMFLFAAVTCYTSTLQTHCYRNGDSITGKRNYTYVEAIKSNLGGIKVKLCGFLQYLNLFGFAIGYTVVASISMMEIERSTCFHNRDGNTNNDNPCHVSNNFYYMIAFGIIQIIFSQIQDFNQIWWVSVIAAVMSFAYSGIGIGLGIVRIVANDWTLKGSLTGIKVGLAVTQTQKIWRIFQALGDIAFAFSFSMVLIEIENTLKSPPAESKTMKRATRYSIFVITLFYMMCGFTGYAAFGDQAPGNLITGFDFGNPFWLVDIANAAIVIHLIGAYQVFCQPLYEFVEKKASENWPESEFVNNHINIKIPGLSPYSLNLFRLVWRTAFVVVVTVISMLLPFFNDIVGLLGAIGFWPLTIYFPIEMYIAQKEIPKWSTRWICLQLLNLVCLVVAIVAAAGSVVGIASCLKKYHPFNNG